jgi:hypothetical protein
MEVGIEVWHDENGKVKGMDDALAAGKEITTLTGEEAEAHIQKVCAEAGVEDEPEDDRPVIVIGPEEKEINDAAVAALARDQWVYQRGNLLVRLVKGTGAKKGVSRPKSWFIDPLPNPLLREKLAEHARWMKETKDGPVPTNPPGWSVSAVASRGNWAGIPVLEAVLDHPVLSSTGEVLCAEGFYEEEGLLLTRAANLAGVPENPTRDDAAVALHELMEVVQDFPFAKPVHCSAWLAALLSPLCRFAFEGCSPLFLADANVRGSGKGLLLDCISRIVAGQRFSVATYSDDTDELRKRITSIAIAGDRCVLFDNVEGKFGDAVLDAAVTATTWEDRILGVSRMFRGPLFVTWYATGNNVSLGGDTSRRTCHIRLESPEERPEERKDFRHPDLLKWVRAHRPRLLRAALTLLRAYVVDGNPDMGLVPWGSFQEWSDLVRNCIVWNDLPDPGETRTELREHADVEVATMKVLLRCWRKMDEEGKGMTASEALARLEMLTKEVNVPPYATEMKAAVEELVGKLDAKVLGQKLAGYRLRVLGDFFLDQRGKTKGVKRWLVRPAGDFQAATRGT